MLYKPYISGHISKWASELSEYQIDFFSGKTIQGQARTDFIVECTLPDTVSYDQSCSNTTMNPIWILNVDGPTGEKYKRAGFILEDSDGCQYAYTLKFLFPISNNKA